MRPEEINYSDTRKHYFDISNGEVLAGAQDKKEYTAHGVDPGLVVEISPLLRDPSPLIEPGHFDYERLDTAEWPHEKYILFAKWLNRLVEPPENARQSKLTTRVFDNARRLGVGPSEAAVRREFSTYSKLYADARISGTAPNGLFTEWDVSMAVAYIRRSGNKDIPPTRADLNRKSKASPGNPGYACLHERFHHIGGFSKLVELAGYPAIRLWDRSDYIDWGVKFMMANDGQIPTARMISYMSTKKQGPNTTTIYEHFGALSDFQAEVVPRFYERRQEAALARRSHLDHIQEELEETRLPMALFGLSPPEDSESMAALEVAAAELYSGDDFMGRIVETIGEQAAITRYAKYKVLEAVARHTPENTKISIAQGVPKDITFTSAIRKRYDILAGEIESEALFLGVFDYIWPTDDYMETLKLDERYEEISEKNRQARREAYVPKRVLSPQTVAVQIAS